MIQVYGVSLSAKIMNAYFPIVHIVQVKLEMVMSKSYVPPCSNRQHPQLSWTHAAVPRHVHCLDDLVNLVMHMIATTLHVQCFAKYNCKIFRVARCISLQTSPAHNYHVPRPRVKICAVTHVKWKADLAVMQVYSLQRKSIPGLGCNCISGSSWCKENGELQLLALSCKETCSCEP